MSLELTVECDKCGKKSTTKNCARGHDVFKMPLEQAPRALMFYEVCGGLHLCWDCADAATSGVKHE